MYIKERGMCRVLIGENPGLEREDGNPTTRRKRKLELDYGDMDRTKPKAPIHPAKARSNLILAHPRIQRA